MMRAAARISRCTVGWSVRVSCTAGRKARHAVRTPAGERGEESARTPELSSRSHDGVIFECGCICLEFLERGFL